MTAGRKTITLLLMLWISTAAVFSQELRLVVSDKPLNEVLNTLGAEVSYDDRAMSAYRVTVSQTFASAHDALIFLLRDKPYKVERIGSVYVVSPRPEDEHPEKRGSPKRYYVYSGTLLDEADGERLPYAYIQTKNGTYTTDGEGVFSFRNETGGPQKISIQYLGYEQTDTVIYPGLSHMTLTPRTVEISRITVTPPPASMMMQSGYRSGEIRINHNVARFMPGNPDNSVFTLLRMMPGVRASGEPSEELIVRGSGSGESRIAFDGYTLFGMKNFNDHISSVNPYLVKDIRLMKGGYGADQAGRAGAVAEISGIDGNASKPEAKANVSNYTANVFASLPVNNRSAFLAAYRQTFYNLYGNSGYSPPKGNGPGTQNVSDIYLKPRYSFRDMNLKYSGKTKSGNSYHISLYGADDRFKFQVEQDGEYAVDAREKNNQYAGAAGYDKVWTDGSTSSFQTSLSKYTAEIDNVTSVGEGAGNKLVTTRTDNSIQEFILKLRHSLNIGERQKVTAGIEWTHYRNTFNSKRREINVPSLFVIDRITFGRLSLEAGLRADIPSSGRAGISPRISARYAFSEGLSATASWGIYRQYISRIPYQYSTGHFEMIWSLSDSTFMRAHHAAGGVVYSQSGWLFSIEGYWRQTHNGLYFLDNSVYVSDNTVAGADLFAKKEFGAHTVFASYSVAGSREPANETSHEIKLGGVSSAGRFFFSANYVFGTGFSYLSTGGHSHGQGNSHGPGQGGSGNNNHGQANDNKSHTYSRFDTAVTYRLNRDKWQLQAGVSLLNVFDNRNIKYSYRLNDQDKVTNIYTRAVPFTPMVFLEVIF